MRLEHNILIVAPHNILNERVWVSSVVCFRAFISALHRYSLNLKMTVYNQLRHIEQFKSG